MPQPDLRLAAGIMKPSGDRARRWKKPSMTPHSVQTDPAASDKQFCRGFHFVNPSAKAGLPLMPARAFSRTEKTATMANKTATMTEKTATVTTKTATIVEKTATIGGLCKYMKWLYLNGHRKDRYDGIDNYLRPQEDRYENGDGY